MTQSWFHKGLYQEYLRQLRVPSIVMLLLFTVFEAFMAVSIILDGYDYSGYYSFSEMHPSLRIMTFAVPFILVLLATHFQNSRRDSDFYHSLPVSKMGVSLSAFAAAVTWMAVLMAVSSIVLWLLGVATPVPSNTSYLVLQEVRFERSFLFMICEVAAAVLSGLLTASVVFLSSMLCGTLLSTITVTGILLFAPFVLTEVLVGYVFDQVQYIYPGGHMFDSLIGEFDIVYNIFGYNLLLTFGSANDNIGVWIATVVGIVAVMAIALWCANRRPSETAGSPSVSPVLQTVFRVLLTLACSLPAVMLIVDGDTDLLSLGMIYLFATAVYFLFELFTTRKVQALIKAIPWYGVFIVLHIACILGVQMGANAMLNYRPEADKIRGVSVVSINYGAYLDNYSDLCIRASKLDKYAELYAESASSQAVVEEMEAKQIVCDALNAGCNHALSMRSKGISCHNRCGGVCEREVAQYHITVAVYDGITKHIREIRLSDPLMRKLMGAVNNVEPLPVLSPEGFAAYTPLVT